MKTERNLVGYAITFLRLMLKLLITEGISIVIAPRSLSQLRRGGRQRRNVNSFLSFPPEEENKWCKVRRTWWPCDHS